ncbi:unnamed protein product, partial [Mesorhabditis spiculigera]
MGPIGLWLLVALLTFSSASREDRFANPPKNYEKHLVFRIFPNTTDQLAALNLLYMKSHEYELDFWKAATGFDQFADIMVRESRALDLARRVNETKAQWKITIPDVQK